jgi:hypothetical protein
MKIKIDCYALRLTSSTTCPEAEGQLESAGAALARPKVYDRKSNGIALHEVEWITI